MRVENPEEQLLQLCEAGRLVRQLGLPCAGRSHPAQYREVGTWEALAAQLGQVVPFLSPLAFCCCSFNRFSSLCYCCYCSLQWPGQQMFCVPSDIREK